MKALVVILSGLSIVFGALALVVSIIDGDAIGAATGGAGVALGFWLYEMRDWV